MGDIIAEGLISSILTTLQASFTRPIPEIAGHVNVNSFIGSVIHGIINELSKEGIFLHSIETVTLPQNDVLSLARGLKEALDKMDMAIGILRGLIDTSV